MRTRWMTAMAVVGAVGCQPPTTAVGGNQDLPDDQWSRGVWLYGQHCAGCHGEDGGGDEETPPLAGEGALGREPLEGSDRTVPFENAADLHAYVSAEMPPLSPGSLGDDEYWAIIHYVLKQAAIEPGTEEIGPQNAAGIKLR